MVLVAAIALGSSPYAWFVSNTQVTATNVNLTAQTGYSLQIADGEKSGFGTTTELANALVTLRPASTIDLTNWYTSNAWGGNGKVTSFTALTKNSTASKTDEGTYNDEGSNTYVYYDTVYLRAGQASYIYLDNTATGLGYGEGFKSFTDGSFTNAQKYLLQNLRIGLRVTQSTENGANSGIINTYVYQLDGSNTDTTVGGKNYITTSSNSADGITYATKDESSTDKVTFTNSTTGVPIIADQMVAGTADAMVTYSAENAAKAIANVQANETVKVEIFIWMEGCDVNCTSANAAEWNAVGAEATAIISNLNLGFCVGALSA